MPENKREEFIEPEAQPVQEQKDTRAIAKTGQLERYDGLMFLRDQPVIIDPSRVPVNTPVRYESSQGLVTITDPIKLQPNQLYQPALPVI